MRGRSGCQAAVIPALLLAAGLLVVVAPAPATGQTCSQLRSCAEAMESLRSGNHRIDGDGDGIPCERTLCEGQRPANTPPKKPGARSAGRLVAGPVVLVSVGDGDTIRVRAGGGQLATVRLACIDAPETAQGKPGAAATAELRGLVSTGRLVLRSQTIDRYGRTVAEVFAAGRNINLEMVRRGAAFVYRQYLRDCDGTAYGQAEQQARQSRRGVWRADEGVERPWAFRSRVRG